MTWVADSANTTEATYTITGAGTVPAVVLDQTAEPDQVYPDGERWQSLGFYTASGTWISVVLLHDAGTLVADAVRLADKGPSTDYTYDAVGNLLTMTDPLENVTTYEYDSLYRVVTVTLPDPDEVHKRCWPVGRP